MVRLKLPPGATAMSEHNVSHWFLLKGPSHFAAQSAALNCLSPPFSPSRPLLTHAHTSSFLFFFSFLKQKNKNIFPCVSYLWQEMEGEGEGERGEGWKRGLSILKTGHWDLKWERHLMQQHKWQHMLLDSRLGPAMQHPKRTSRYTTNKKKKTQNIFIP